MTMTKTTTTVMRMGHRESREQRWHQWSCCKVVFGTGQGLCQERSPAVAAAPPAVRERGPLGGVRRVGCRS